MRKGTSGRERVRRDKVGEGSGGLRGARGVHRRRITETENYPV